MPYPTEKGPNRIHLVGAGGVGMSALAQALLDSGVTVSGSDRTLDQGDLTPTLATLRHQGVTLYPQDGTGVTSALTRMVISSAIEADNPDLLAAKKHDIPLVHRAAELATITAAHRELIAVTGTSGKSSVTAMVGWLLSEAGYDPLVINGAAICGWDNGGQRIGSVRRGDGIAVIEADESDRSLLCFKPHHAIITNVSADHFDLATTRALFDEFRALVSGEIIASEPPAADILPATGWQGCFRYHNTTFTLPLPGRHNCHNAWQAVALCHKLGVPLAQLADSLARFPGVERRLQRVGSSSSGVTVIDDYGHNPAKLAAAWRTVAAVFPRIVGLWRPHGYAPLRNNLQHFADTFAEVVRPADRLLLLPVYDAGGTATRDVNAADLLALLKPCNLAAEVVPDIATAAGQLQSVAAPDTAILICGARDPELPRLARRLANS